MDNKYEEEYLKTKEKPIIKEKDYEDIIYFLDCETGGLKSYINGISSLTIKDLNNLYDRTFLFKPQKKVYEYSAIKVNRLTLESLYNDDISTDRTMIIDELRKLYMKTTINKPYLIFCGWNVSFDMDFILQIYKETKSNLPCPIMLLDLMEIAKNNIKKIDKRKKDDDGVEDYKLTTIYQYYFKDFKKTLAHTSDYDVLMTRKLFKKFISLKYIKTKLL